MTDEIKTKEPDFLEQVKAERLAMEQTKADIAAQLREIRELKAREIMGGKSDLENAPVKAPEISPQEYAKLALEGKVPRK